MGIFKIAWRNVWRNQRRTIVTIGAMSLALTVMILWAGLIEGYLEGMERNILELEVGDLQIFANDYRDNPSIYTRIDQPDALLSPLWKNGFDATARLLAFGMVAAGEASAGVSFRGVDIEQDAEVSEIHREVASGNWLDESDPSGVVIGRRLARILAVEVGSELVVLTQGADGSMAYDLFTVRGILRGIGDATDRGGVFLDVDVLRELIVVPGGVHQIIVRRPEGIELGTAEQMVRDLAGDNDVKTWRQLLPTLASLLDSTRSLMVVMFVIVYVAIGILILNAMLMAVFERVREFGVLKAIGAGPVDVMRLILAECAIQTGLAVAIGVAISIPSVAYLADTGLDIGSLAGVSIMGIAMDPLWKAVVSPYIFAMPIGVLLSIVVLAVLYPALKAALIEPVEAMRHQ
ncbi:MAG: FtsX-like permease family protein [Myxococcota bacterium]